MIVWLIIIWAFGAAAILRAQFLAPEIFDNGWKDIVLALGWPLFLVATIVMTLLDREGDR